MSPFAKNMLVLILLMALSLANSKAGETDYSGYSRSSDAGNGSNIYNSFVVAVQTKLTPVFTQVSKLAEQAMAVVTAADQLVYITVPPIYVDGDTFTIPGDFTSKLAANKMVLLDLGTDGVKFNSVASSSRVGGTTTVKLNSANLTPNLSRVAVLASRDGLRPWGDGRILGRDFGKPGQAAFDAALAFIGPRERTLVLGPGNWGRPTAAPPVNVTIHAERGALIDPGDTDLTLKSFSAGLYKVFNPTGAGIVKFDPESTEKIFATWFGFATSASAETNAAALQAAVDSAYKNRSGVYRCYPYIYILSGKYNIGASINLYSMSRVKGAGIYATILNFTTANPGFTCDIKSRRIALENMQLEGGKVATFGTYFTKTHDIQLINVYASNFLKDGLYFQGCITPRLIACRAEDNGRAGAYFDFVLRFGNSNGGTIDGGSYRQNMYGIFLGHALHGFHIKGSPVIESNLVSPGIGLYIYQGCQNITCDTAYFENNIIHAVVGEIDGNSRFKVPINIDFRNCFFERIEKTGIYFLKIYAGTRIKIDGCRVFNAKKTGIIYLHKYADNPILQNLSGHWKLVNQSGYVVNHHVATRENALTKADVTVSPPWHKNNCTATLAKGESNPLTDAPVYAITETIHGPSSIRYLADRASFDLSDSQYTIGVWVKSADQDAHQFWWYITTSKPLEEFTTRQVDCVTVGKDWTWIHIGRNIPATSGGNIGIALMSEIGSYFVSDFKVMKGIVYSPPSRWR